MLGSPHSQDTGWGGVLVWPIPVFSSPAHSDWSRDGRMTQVSLGKDFAGILFFGAAHRPGVVSEPPHGGECAWE